MDEKTIQALQDFIDGWPHFCDCINFGESNLDAEAIRFMNEAVGEVARVLEQEKAKRS